MQKDEEDNDFNNDELKQLAYRWLTDIRGEVEGSDAGMSVVAMNFSATPDVQWRFILIAVSLAESDDELSYVAAGPIEHLLGWHGESFIDVVENEAASNPKFARALTSVRQYMMSDEVWSRVRTLQRAVSELLPPGSISSENNTAEADSPIHKTWIMLHAREKKDGFNCLSDVEKTFYRIYFLELAAYGGGGFEVWFDQGEHLNQVVTALRNIGALESARIVEDAMKFVFPEGIAPLDQEARQSYIPVDGEADEAWFTRLERFEKAYRQDPDNLDLLLIAYAREHNFLVE